MSQNLAEKIRIMTVLAGAITANGDSTAGDLKKVTKGILLIDVISKANNDNIVTLQCKAAPAGSTTFANVGSAIAIASGAAARVAPVVLTGLPPGGTFKITTSAIGGTTPSLTVRILLIGFLSRIMPTAHDFVTGFDTNGV